MFSYIPNNTLSRAELNYENGEYQNIHYGDVLVKFGAILDADAEHLPFITEGQRTKLENMLLQDGDVIIADTAEDETVGKATEIINIGSRKVVSGLHTFACRPLIDMTPTYLGFYINSEYYHKQLFSLMQGVKVLSISKSNIEDTLISYPPRTEQDKICSFLNLIEARIDKQKHIVELLKKYKRGVSNSFFNDKVVSECSSILSFGQVVEINPKTKSLPTEFIYIDLECVESGKLLHENIISRDNAPSRAQRVLSKGDVLFQMVRPYQKNNFYFESELSLPSVASTGYAQIRCNENDPMFVFEQISSDYFTNQAMLRSTGTGYPAINSDSLAEIPYINLPLSQQKRIGEFLFSLGKRIACEEEVLNRLYDIKSALLGNLFI